ncbi:hypothetical protein MSAN_01535700 [Mycena sanguinolenta]|uniref:Uncharacterized protein n=1 Tax=Mycena sanguinolenta TaxID=230812 RepID=A0A8H6Y7W2_9AGAR|nr:hypothetical protein MSAN_01535700 [Mycena sanguinolenta]
MTAYPYLLIGTWINCMLFTLELALALRYFQHSSRPLLHRVGIAAMVMSDLLCTFTIFAKVYRLVLQACQPTSGYSEYNMETLAVILCSTYATASIAQLFLCTLYFNLTRRRTISAFLIFTIVVHLGFSYASAILVVVNGTPMGWAMLTSKIGAISCAVTDSMIAAALLDTFIRLDKTSAFRVSTHNLLRRLIILSFSSGVVVASTTLLSVILTFYGKSAYALSFYSQGRVYALTILGNFAVGAREQKTQTVTTAPTPSALTVVLHLNQTSAGECDVRRCEHP